MALSLPRFELRFGTEDLSAALRALGVEQAFEGNTAASGPAFARMTDDPEAYLNAVLHQVGCKAHAAPFPSPTLYSRKRCFSLTQRSRCRHGSS